MTKEQLVEAISAHYDELNDLNKIDNFYDYESDFIKIWGKMGREVLEKNISTLSGDRRKKNSNRFWRVDNSQQPSLQRSSEWLSNKSPDATANDLLRAVRQL